MNKECNQNKNRMHYINTAPPYSYQIGSINIFGYDPRFLLCVEIISRKAYVYILKTNDKNAFLEAYRRFVKDLENVSIKPNNVFGSNMYDFEENENLPKIIRPQKIYDIGILNSLERNIKNKIEKHIQITGSMEWTKYLHDIIDAYNKTPHRSLPSRLSPAEIFPNITLLMQLHEYNEIYNNKIKSEHVEKFKRGQNVKIKNQIPKDKTYIINRMEDKYFVLFDTRGKEVRNRFREYELIPA